MLKSLEWLHNQFQFLGVIVLNNFLQHNPRDLGANDVQNFWQIVLPLIASSLIGVALFGFTLFYDGFTRTSLIAGESNTLPLEIFGMTTNVTTPALYALGSLTNSFSFLLIALTLTAIQFFSRRQVE